MIAGRGCARGARAAQRARDRGGGGRWGARGGGVGPGGVKLQRRAPARRVDPESGDVRYGVSNTLPPVINTLSSVINTLVADVSTLLWFISTVSTLFSGGVKLLRRAAARRVYPASGDVRYGVSPTLQKCAVVPRRARI